MKKIILVLMLMLTGFMKGNSQILEENFEYPAGDSIGAHGWQTFSGGSVNRITITSPGLMFANYSGSGIGNSVYLVNIGQDVYGNFTSAKDTLSLYISFMVSVDTARSGDFFAALLPSTSTALFTGRVYVKDSSGALAFGLSKTTAAAGGIFYTNASYSYNTTYLLVLKYKFNESGNTDDEVSLFVFNSFVPSDEPAPDIGPLTGTGTDLNDAGRFALRQGSSSSSPELFLDGIFATTHWDNNALPVELTYFISVIDGRDVILNWSTESEINNSGFKIERSEGNGYWNEIGFVKGNGNSAIRHDYSFADRGLGSGKYFYRLRQMDFNGNFEIYKLIDEINIGNPEKFTLHQNYPNPFNPVTKIDFNLPRDAFVKLTVCDITGKETAVLLNELKKSGYYSKELDISEHGSVFSSGVYFYELTALAEGINYKEVKRMMVLK